MGKAEYDFDFLHPSVISCKNLSHRGRTFYREFKGPAWSAFFKQERFRAQEVSKSLILSSVAKPRLNHIISVTFNGIFMLTVVQWIHLFVILLIAVAGGYFPFAKTELTHAHKGFPRGEAFSSGVFLALSLTMLLPAAFQNFQREFPELNYPIGSVIAILAFLGLLAMEHLTQHAIEREQIKVVNGRLPARIPLVMTTMIALPSFFLGTSLGMSDNTQATLIFIAIILHKGTAGFALMLTMVRSTLSRGQILLLFSSFALSTPLGIIIGGFIHNELSPSVSIVKAIVLSLGAGTFLYMGTLHEMKHASLIEHCGKRNCFLAMVAGLFLTALVRYVMGNSHHF